MTAESETENSRISGLARALADPLRLRLLGQLMADPRTVSELIVNSGASQSNVSNHLSVLRECGLVKVSSIGRQKLYELAGIPVARLVESLVSISGGMSSAGEVAGGIAQARTCYDHLAGKLGVALFNGFVKAKAIEMPALSDRQVGRDRGNLALGPSAARVFRKLDVDIDEARRQRRNFASYCIDWTEHSPHLSGALGALVWRRFLENGWGLKQPGSRSVIVTKKGRDAMRELFHIDFDAL